MALAEVDYPVMGAFWTLLMFFTFVIWLWLLFTVFADIFSRHDIGGWPKAFWVIGLVILPYFGVLVYLIAQHKGMAERSAKAQVDAKKQFDEYVKQAAGSSASPADELHKAKALLDSGAITQAEFDALKAKTLA